MDGGSDFLVVRHRGRERREPLRDGITIGRDGSCTISVDDCDLCPVHARVYQPIGTKLYRVKCVVAGFSFTLPDGNEARDVCLEPGTALRIGSAVEIARNGVDDAPLAAAMRVSCARCGGALLQVPAQARFCPHCGAPLPICCSPWALNLSRFGVNDDPATLKAYRNALLNLGIRSEHAALDARDLEQAFRYYQKAAQLSSLGSPSG
jgi:hypothetical protein